MSQSRLNKPLALLAITSLLMSGLSNISGSGDMATADVPNSDANLKTKTLIDYYANLNGSSNSLASSTTQGPIPATGDFTVEAWVFQNSSATGIQTILSQGPTDGFSIQVGGTGALSKEVVITYEGVERRSLIKLPQDRWVHLAASAGATNIKLYLDSNLVSTISTSTPTGPTGKLFVGRDYSATPAQLWSGRIDQVKIWSKELSASEVLTSMHAWGPDSISNLVAHYDFNDPASAGGVVFNRASQVYAGNHLEVSGAIQFVDVKTSREIGGKTAHTFTRSYLTEVGGWVAPTGVNSIADALLVAGGGGGGRDTGGGGGGGSSQVGSIASISANQVFKVTVGQGGQSDNNGQDTSIVVNSKTVLAGGGVKGSGWPAATGGSGGSATSLNDSGFIFSALAGAAGGSGPDTSGDPNNRGARSSGSDGLTSSNIESAGLRPRVTYGGGGGGGIQTTNDPDLIINSLPSSSGGAGGGGAGAGTSTAKNDTYVCASNVYGISTGFSGVPNTGGGGGGGAGKGDQCATSPNTGYDGERTFGGQGGSGLVVLVTNVVPRCAYYSSGFILTKDPKMELVPLSGVAGTVKRLTPVSTTIASYFGNPVVLDGYIYYIDRGRNELRRMNQDGSNPTTLAKLPGNAYRSVVTDGVYLYGQTIKGIFRYKLDTKVFEPTWIGIGAYAPENSSIAYWFDNTNNKAYLFTTTGNDYVGTGGAKQESIYRIPLDPKPAAINRNPIESGGHLYSRTRLSATEAIPEDTAADIVTLGNNVIWGTMLPRTGGKLYIKSAGETTSGYADRRIRTIVYLQALAVAGNRVYFNEGAFFRSADLTTNAMRLENSASFEQNTVGLALSGDCATASGSGFTLGSALTSTAVTANWSTMPGAGTKRQILQYRLNGGPWTQVLDNSTAKTASIARSALPAGFAGYVDFRISSFEFGVWSDWVNSAPVLIAPLDPPACTSPMKLKYQVKSGNTVNIRLHDSVTPVTISWGDGSANDGPETFVGTSNYSHLYANAGTYTVDICGSFKGFGGVSQTFLTEVVAWGDEATKSDSALVSLTGAFQASPNLTKVPATFPPNVTKADGMFTRAEKFNDPNVSGWDVSKVTTMATMFSQAFLFNQPLSTWDTSNVQDFSYMFFNARAFNQNISGWNTSAAKNLSAMFYGASIFNQPVGNWNTSSVEDMSMVFGTALAFNQPLADWNTASVTTMHSMFFGAKAFNQPLPTSDAKWDVSKVTTMWRMFQGATAFNSSLSGWNTTGVEAMNSMFEGATSFNQNTYAWETGNVKDFARMFYGASRYGFKPPLKIASATRADNMLDYSGISDDTYGEALVAWNALTDANTPDNLSLGAVDKTAACSAPQIALLGLIGASNNWTITDKTTRTAGFCTPTVTVTADDTTQIYGNAAPSVGFTVTSGYSGEDWIKEITCTANITSGGAEVASTTPAGTSSYTKCSGPSGSGIGLAITYVNGTHTISKRELAVTIKNLIKTPSQGWVNISSTGGQQTDNYIVTSGLLVGADQLTVNISGPTVATPITAGTYALNGSISNNNYDVTFTSGTLTVATATYALTGRNKVKVYGDVLTLNNGTDWICEATGCETNLSGLVSLSSTGTSATAPVGSYSIISSVTGNPTDYQVVNTNGGSITIIKRPLTVTPRAISIQGGSEIPEYSYTITGWANNEDERAEGFTAPTCTSGYDQKTPRGTDLLITCSGGSASNYYFVYETANLNVLSAASVTDSTPSNLEPDEELGGALVPFKFDINPYNSICYGNLVIYSNIEGEGADGLEPHRFLITSSTVEFELALVEGEYTYELVLDGNCYVEPVSRDLKIGVASFFSAPLNIVKPMVLSPAKAPIDKFTSATITGENLSRVKGLTIGGKNAAVISQSDSKLEIRIPKLKAGTYDILLLLDDGTTLRWQSPLTVGSGKAMRPRSKTFASFSAGSFKMPSSIRNSITKFLKANKGKYSTVECVGYTDGPFVRRLDVPLAMNRARVACGVANNLGYKVVSRSYVNEDKPGSKLRRVKLILGK